VAMLTVLTQIAFQQIQAQSTLPDAPESGAAFALKPDQPATGSAFTGKRDQPAIINGRPYVRPSRRDQFKDYLRDTYGLPALARTSVRAAYGQGMGKPDEWGQDWAGFGQRFGSSAAVTVIDGNARYGMETVFREDMRYIPCHGCSVKRKIENALLAEITARHDRDGHRFFTLTPLISDMTGPIIANSFWVPDHGPVDGVIGSRVSVATRIGGHLFTEFVLELRHHDQPLPD
jgi:hypothetical protein